MRHGDFAIYPVEPIIRHGNAVRIEEYDNVRSPVSYTHLPVIIIDEYDTPIQEGYSKDFYDEIIGFMRNFFSGAFKDLSLIHI